MDEIKMISTDKSKHSVHSLVLLLQHECIVLTTIVIVIVTVFWSWPAHYRGIRLFHFCPRQAKILTTVNVCMVKSLWRYAHFQERLVIYTSKYVQKKWYTFFWRPFCSYKTFIQKIPELVPQKFHVHLELLLFALKSERITNFINNWVGIHRELVIFLL